ncbi:MAG: amidohydrolase [Kiritimatiellae bacterium]|nr:amidohydrolase [Kiritimatiellia bacterium]
MIYAADWIVTQNPRREKIRRGAILVRGGRVAAVGPALEIAAAHPGEQVEDFGRAAIFPGLVDSHCHLPMSPLRGLGDDKPLFAWLQEDIFPREARLTQEAVYEGALLSCRELARTGCTSFYDMYMLEEGVFAAADETGLRGVLGENVTRFFPQLGGATREALFARMRRNIAAWSGHPRLRAAVCPHAPYTTDPETLRACRALCDETGALFGMHLAETQKETEDCVAERGLRPVAYCDSLGLLRPDATFFHCVHVTPEETALLRDRGCVAVHNPASNMKLASGTAPVPAMVRAGLPVALGTDGPASNNQQNMVREMWLAALLGKASSGDPSAMTAQMALDMATLGGAAALHDPDIGSLEPGKHADFFVLDLGTEPNTVPVHDPVSTFVYAATGHENRLTVVAGRPVYRR